MSWSQHMDVPYFNTSYPYNTAGSFIEYFEGLTYQHLNFIFDGASQVQPQENVYPSANTNFYKFGASGPGTISYYDHCDVYEVNDSELQTSENRIAIQNSSVTDESTTAIYPEWEVNANANSHDNPIECPRRLHSSRDYQLVLQDNIDPDNMTYEELLELGEAVGTQSRGLSQELISLLPVSKYKCGFFFKKKSRNERCVICQMEYKRGDRRITLPCKHLYHAVCGSRWLSINKACPICYTEVFGDASKQMDVLEAGPFLFQKLSLFFCLLFLFPLLSTILVPSKLCPLSHNHQIMDLYLPQKLVGLTWAFERQTEYE